MKKNSITLVVSFGKLTPRFREESRVMGADFAFHLSAQDFTLKKNRLEDYEESSLQILTFLLELPLSNRKIGQLHIVNLSDERVNRLLDFLETFFEPDVFIDVYGSRLKGATFGRLVDLADFVTLQRCHIGIGWWSAAKNPRATSLSLCSCTGVKPQGRTANFKLQYLLVDEGVRHLDLERDQMVPLRRSARHLLRFSLLTYSGVLVRGPDLGGCSGLPFAGVPHRVAPFTKAAKVL